MLNRLLDRIFTEEETLPPRLLVGAGLAAYALMLTRPLLGSAFYAALPVMLAGIAALSYGAMRALGPMLDTEPGDAGTDRPLIWAAGLLAVLIGFASFGIWFVPGLAGGVGLVALRAPELGEVLTRRRRLSSWTFEGRNRD